MPTRILALQGVVERLAELAGPWQSLYADSAVISATVNFAHVGALVVGGGLAIAADRQTVRAARGNPLDRARQLGDLGGVHRIVLVALAVVVASGVWMFLADVEEFATSAVYWTKMALVALLLANGARMTRIERGLREAATASATQGWLRLRLHAVASVALWLAITLAGVVLRES